VVNLKKSALALGLLMSITLVTGCVTTGTETPTLSKSNLTAGQVSLTLKKDITKQSEVVEVFGAPNLVTQNGDGEEVWTYQKHATVTNASSTSGYATVILAGVSSRSSGLEQSSRTMTLIIKFKSVGGVKVVSDFSSRYSSF
jgi:hypothetical protein